MKKAIGILASGLLFTLFGCAQMAPQQQAEMQTITLPGTGDSTDILRELAQNYSAKYPERQVLIPDSISTDGGIKVVGEGKYDVARIARLPNAEEIAKWGNYKYIEFAKIPVTFVVTRDTGVTDLDEQQICDIMSGEVTNWKDVGGSDLAIDVQSRPDIGSNMQAIRKNIGCAKNIVVTPKATYQYRNGDLVNGMKTLAGAIGYMPLSEALINDIQTISLNGVSPDEPNYKLGIGLGFTWIKPMPKEAAAFIEYLHSEEAQQVMRQTGHTPIASREAIVQVD